MAPLHGWSAGLAESRTPAALGQPAEEMVRPGSTPTVTAAAMITTPTLLAPTPSPRPLDFALLAGGAAVVLLTMLLLRPGRRAAESPAPAAAPQARPQAAGPKRGAEDIPLSCTLTAIEVDDSGLCNELEEFILSALGPHPERADLRFRLLQFYHDSGNVEAFNEQARLYMLYNKSARGFHWHEACRMGRDLDPAWSLQKLIGLIPAAASPGLAAARGGDRIRFGLFGPAL